MRIKSSFQSAMAALQLLVVAACSGSSGPGDSLKQMMRNVEDGDIEAAAEAVSVSGELSGVLTEQKLRAVLSDQTREIAEKGGLDSIEVQSEDVDGPIASVRVSYAYGNGSREEETLSMMRIDGKWKVLISDDAPAVTGGPTQSRAGNERARRASSEDESPQGEAFRLRHAVMQMAAYKVSRIGGMHRGEIPVDEDLFARSAQDLAKISGMVLDGFMTEGAVSDSRALPEIWENWADFEAKAEAFRETAQRLADTTERQGYERAQEHVQALQETCSDCHEQYRAR